MLRACSAFSSAKQVLAINLVEMRPLNPDGLFGQVHAAIHRYDRIRNRFERLCINFADPDRAMPLIEGFALRGVIVQDVDLAVLVKEKRRVDPANMG